MVSEKIPYPAIKEGEIFDQKVAQLIHDLLRQNLSSLIPPGNSYFLPHGKRWALQRADEPGELKSVSSEGVLTHEQIIENNPSLLVEFIGKVVGEMAAQMKRLIFEAAGNAAGEVGNSISLAEYATLAEAFLETMRRIEFGVDESGNVRIPSVYVHPENSRQFLSELRRQPSSFSREVQAVKARKKLSALEGEVDRLKRFFVRPDSEVQP
jgi:hypothetical protein